MHERVNLDKLTLHTGKDEANSKSILAYEPWDALVK